ncbi:condensation domain-containing protein [Streptomyces sp. M19]
MRARLIRLAPEEHLLVLVVHHLAFDGWSVGVFWTEFHAAYRAALSQGPAPTLPVVGYRDFAAWQRERLTGALLDGQLAYWRERLTGTAPLELPTDHPARRPSGRGDHVDFTLPAALLADLRAVGQRQNATLFMVLLAGFQALLARWSGGTDIAVGAPIAGRDRAELESLIGFFVNTLVLRTDLSGDPTFEDLVARARETALVPTPTRTSPSNGWWRRCGRSGTSAATRCSRSCWYSTTRPRHRPGSRASRPSP